MMNAFALSALSSRFVLLLLCFVLTYCKDKCTNGPYIYDDSCQMVSQGVGSSMNRMKYQIVLAQVYNLTIIPNPTCFKSSEHSTDLMDYFGWAMGSKDCSYKDVMAAASKLADQDESSKTIAAASSSNALNALKLNAIVVTKMDENHGNENEDNKELVDICRDIQNQKDDFVAKAKSIVSKSRPENDLFPSMNRLYDGGKMKNNVYIFRNRYLVEGYMCSRKFIRNQWISVQKLLHNTHGVDKKQDKIAIAIHFRHGDVATKDVNFIDPRYETRTITLNRVLDILNSFFQSDDNFLYQKQHLCTITFYSEGNASEFKSLSDVYPQVQFSLGDSSTIQNDMNDMATSDIFITSPSSFSSLISAINTNGVILSSSDNPEKFEGITNMMKQDILIKKDFKEFHSLLCDLKSDRIPMISKKCHDLGFVPKLKTFNDDLQVQRHYHHTHHAHHDGNHKLHMEIKQLQTKLKQIGTKEFDLHAMFQENESFTTFWKDFVDQSHNVSCFRNNSIITKKYANNKEHHETVCSSAGSAAAAAAAANNDDEISTNFHFHFQEDQLKKKKLSDLQLSYFVRSIASIIIKQGFQIPVYIVAGPNQKRITRLKINIKQANIESKYVTWQSNYLADSLTEEDKSIFMNNRDAYSKCAQILTPDACRGGYQFSKMEMSVALKHVAIMKDISKHTNEQLKEDGKNNNNADLLHKYSLIIEDDQFLPNNILQQVVEVLLSATEDIGIIMLDDSFFYNGNFAPPKSIENFPFPKTYPKNDTRTMGAYLISNDAAKKIIDSGEYIPLYSPVDHQLRNAILKSNVITHWIFPPMTCAGSQGLETMQSSTGGTAMDRGDRIACMHCCDRFYDIDHMEPFYNFASTVG